MQVMDGGVAGVHELSPIGENLLYLVALGNSKSQVDIRPAIFAVSATEPAIAAPPTRASFYRLFEKLGT